jgi:hypothetical protein
MITLLFNCEEVSLCSELSEVEKEKLLVFAERVGAAEATS